MAWSHVQNLATGATGSGTSQQTLAAGANPTVGNYLVAFAWGFNGGAGITGINFSDTGGNAWTQVVFKKITAATWVALGYAKVTTSAASFKITAANNDGSSGTIVVCGSEFNPGGGTVTSDGSVSGTAATGNPAPGSLAFTAGDLLLAAMACDEASYVGPTPTGFTRADFESSGTSFEAGEGCYAIAPTSPTNPTWAGDGGGSEWVAAQFALKSTGGGAAVTHFLATLGCGG